MPRKHSLLWGVLLALFISLLSFYSVSAEGENPTPCQFQPPATDRTPTAQNVRQIGKGTSENITWDETYVGLHRWNTGQWPGVDFWVPTTVAFKNGGTVRMATWDDAGGGYSLFIDGEGPCQGWYIFIGHLTYNPAQRYSQGQHIGPDEVVGEPGCSGFTCSQALPAHNHYSLGYQKNIFSFADGTVPAYAGGYYWIHPARVESATSALPVAQTTQEAFVENIEEVAVIDSTNGGNMVDLYTLEFAEGTRLPFSIPLWAYATAGIGVVVLFSKRYRPLGLACVIATAVLVVGFYQGQAKPVNAEALSPEVPPQMVVVDPEIIIVAFDEATNTTKTVQTDGKLEGFPDHGKEASPPANCLPISIKVSHYWPPWGGPNCASFYNNYCHSHMASGKKWEDYTGYAVAMPSSIPFGSKVYAFGHEWEVMDRGGKIIQNGSSYWVDFLHPESPLPYGTETQACIVYP